MRVPGETAGVRGVVVIGLMAWLRKSYGPAAARRFIDQLPEGVQRDWRRPCLPGRDSVPAEAFALGARSIIARWGREAYHHACGSVALRDLSSYMNFYLRPDAPDYVAHRLPNVYRRYLNTGCCEVQVERGRVRVSVHGAEAYGPGVVEGVLGWCSAALEYAGARGLATICAIEPDHSAAIYDFRWR